jgi:DNA-binding NtrC family response regulator
VNDKLRTTGEILIIDDDAIMRDLIADWLEAAGYQVRKVAGCEAGAAELDRAPPALVVSDMWMPGPCGAEAIQWMQREHPEVRIIAISGHFGFGHGCTQDAAVAAGAARALAKPVKRAELLSAVAELIGPPVQSKSK